MYGDTIVSNPGLYRFWNDYWYLNISHSPQINANANNSPVPEPCDYVKWFPLTDTVYVGVCRQFMWSLDDYPESNRDYNSIPVNGSSWKKPLPIIDQNLRLVASRRDFSSYDINRNTTDK